MQNEIKTLSDESLLKKTRELVQEERRVMTLVLRHLLEIESRKLFCDLGYSSLFDYCVKELGYSESSAQRRIASMRLIREIPEIEEKIEDGSLSLSVISQAQTFFRNEKVGTVGEKKEVLSLLEKKSTREAEKELIARSSNPVAMMPERVRPVTQTHSEIKLIASRELLEQLEKIKGLLAHSHPGMSMAELVEYMAKLTLEKIDPAREPKRSVAAPEVNEEK